VTFSSTSACLLPLQPGIEEEKIGKFYKIENSRCWVLAALCFVKKLAFLL
jgi:hypothetical protein